MKIRLTTFLFIFAIGLMLASSISYYIGAYAGALLVTAETEIHEELEIAIKVTKVEGLAAGDKHCETFLKHHGKYGTFWTRCFVRVDMYRKPGTNQNEPPLSDIPIQGFKAEDIKDRTGEGYVATQTNVYVIALSKDPDPTKHNNPLNSKLAEVTGIIRPD